RRFKCGESDSDMFRDLATGLEGTPMPSFATAMTADQRWDVVHYIRTLSNPKARASAKTDAYAHGNE
ncbi:MAG: c-type cytochrome, partial [Candidatus Sulfotelmatobacter sp.]